MRANTSTWERRLRTAAKVIFKQYSPVDIAVRLQKVYHTQVRYRLDFRHQMKTIQLPVRDFALPVPRRGSIEVNSGYQLLNQGQEIHDFVQKLRKKEDPYYRSEVKVTHNFVKEPYKFCVSGRIDGIFDRFPLLIEEIKSTVNVYQLKAKLELTPDHPYILQAQTYAYLYYKVHGLLPKVRLHLISSSNRQQSENLDIPVDLAVYEAWVEKRLAELVLEIEALEADISRRMELPSKFGFPFEQAREGQIQLMDSVAKAIDEKKSLVVQAPTGLGKTMAVTYPSLRDALTRGQKLVYLTPKNSQHSVAEDAIEHLQKQAPDLHALTLTAKSKICFKPEPICTPEYCEYARNYYQKVWENDLINVMASKPRLNFDMFQELGKQYEVCPFELSVDAIARADVVIGDYNYVFSPRSLVGRITQYNDYLQEKPNLVIDEAHNLPDRACTYYSPSLFTFTFEEANKQARSLPPGLSIEAQAVINRSLEIINSHRDKYKKESQVQIEGSQFKDHDKRWKELIASYLQSGQIVEKKDAIVRAANEWSQFADGVDFESDNFFVTSRQTRNGLELKVTCCDASEYLRDSYDKFSTTIGFSATLKPFDYYIRLSGFDEEKTKTLECSSPFPADNRKLLVIPQVSTKYSDRVRNYDKISEVIRKIIALRPGNYFAFFPSFEFLNEVANRTKAEEFEILQQRPDMKSDEVRQWIDRLRNTKNRDSKEKPTLIFAVQGGVFSEGIDYPGESLIGALIIGPALPKYDLERELLREYYERHYKSGFDYAYTYPAMTRVIQSAGRVIRSDTDRGLIVLMDQRFTQKSYTNAMPADWFKDSIAELVSKSILKDITDFWQRVSNFSSGALK